MKNIRNVIYYGLTLLFINAGLYAQVSQTWASIYNGTGDNIDIAFSMAVDNSGNVYVTGYSFGSGTNQDFTTIKYNSAGVQQWVSRYNGPGNGVDASLSLAIDGSGNVYVAGYSFGGGTGYDYATVKYNSAGVQQWASRYNGTGNSDDIGYYLLIDGSGNVYATGYSTGSGSGFDYATVKYNSAGVQQWASRYNGTGNGTDMAYSMALDNSQNVYVTGQSSGTGTGNDYATVKYNSAGVQQWASRYNGTGNGSDIAASIASDLSGNCFVTGKSTGNGTGFDYLTIKYNSSGDSTWVARYNGPGNLMDGANAVIIDGSGNTYVTGQSNGGASGNDYATIKYNSAGSQQWISRYNGPGNFEDDAIYLAVDGAGNIYVTGNSIGSGSAKDFATLKYDPAGIQQWVQRYNGAGNGDDGGNRIVVDTSGNVYVTGGATGSTGVYDFGTLKYSQPIGIQPVSTEIPENYSLSQNYPNPFNPNTIIKFQIANLSNTKLIVYNILGEEVGALVNEQLKAGTYKVNWNTENLSTGVYFYTLNAGEYNETKKMLMIK